MKHRFTVILIACALLAVRPAWPHRMDEYLQATILSLEPGTISLTMRLVPGIAVSSAVIAAIDRNGDGVLSTTEQTAYAERVLADLGLTENGRSLKLHVVRAYFPAIAQMQAGVGEITIVLAADLPSANGNHQLTFDNHHQSAMSVYLVNALVPKNVRFRIESQNRNRNQSLYRLSFTESPSGDAVAQDFHLSGFAGAFRLGMRHIAEGTDHLLFLLTLLLPAPLLAVGGRWSQSTLVRKSLIHILGIVTAFTVGHSLTLALSAFGLVQLPNRPVEVLVAVSILVSAIHALHPIFPGKEAAIAAFFGLVHGLAFASALNELGMTGWYRLVSLLGFNLGIETMQLLVVLMVLPSLLLLSRTNWYTQFRMVNGCLAACASVAWIFERVTNRANEAASLIEETARHCIAMAVVLFIGSLLAWFLKRPFHRLQAHGSRTESPVRARRSL
jgi:hypothetical protein